MKFIPQNLEKYYKYIILTFLGLGIALAVVYSFYWTKKPQAPPEIPFVVEAYQVKRGGISKVIKLLGKIKPRQQASFVSHQKGRLKGVYVEEGQEVKKGTLLAELDNDEILREFAYAKEQERLAKIQFERIKELYDQNSQSKANLDRAKNDWLNAKIVVQNFQNRLKVTQFIMPFDGICGVFKVRVGQSVVEGDDIVYCYDTTELTLQLDVPESIIQHVKAGQAIEYKKQKGSLASVQKMLDPQTHMGIAIAQISNDWPVSLGQLVSVRVEIEKKEDVLTVPRSAIFMKGGQSFVYTIENDKADLTPVQLGLTAQETIEITEGLKEGDRVIIKGQENLWPTRAVTTQDQEKDSKPADTK